MRHVKTAMAALLLAALGGGSAAIFVSAPAPAQTTVKLELWSRQDPSGPLRPANVVKAADRLNKELAAEGSGKRVKVAVHESPAPGFDDDALQLLKVFGIGQGPDLFIAAHEWICAFQQEGFALKLDDYIAKYPQYFATIFPSLWQSVKCSDGIYGIPQDAEARMFFYNKKLLREAGYDDAFIEAMPARTLSGELTMDDVIDIANRVINKAKAQYGILHRPNKGPDYIMAFQSYGNNSSIPALASSSLNATSSRRRSAGSSAASGKGSFRPTTPRWSSTRCARRSTRETRHFGCMASGISELMRFRPTGCQRTRLGFLPIGDGLPHRPQKRAGRRVA